MTTLTPIRSGTAGATRDLKLAVLGSFYLPRANVLQRMTGFTAGEWEKVMGWLDMSGMALYFLDQMWSLGADQLMPASVEAQLHDRLKDNRLRTKAMLNETRLLSIWFERAGIPHAVLKGITLAPQSVPDTSLRWQADLDFLVPEQNAALAVHFISRLGYGLHARSGSTLEFRAGPARLSGLRNMYSTRLTRALELHLAGESSSAADRLSRRQAREVGGGIVSSLAPADILVQQALHLLKHLLGEHTRISWVLEFWRHVQARRGAAEFWRDVEQIAISERNGDLAMSIAFWLAEALFDAPGGIPPPHWRADRLPDRVRVWLEMYAVDVLLSDGAGSKTYALLKQEIPGESQDKRSLRQVLLPSTLPIRGMSISTESAAGLHEPLMTQLRYTAQRCRFHIVEGIRFAFRAARWRRAIARCSL